MSITHLLLVSKQPVPNLTPLLDPQLRPDRVILLVSPDMQQRAEWLHAVIQPRGIKIETIHIDDPWDIITLRQRIALIVQAQNPDTRLILNATGGTKPMSIAAYEVFRSAGKEIFYIHPDQDQLIWMNPAAASHELADRIKLPHFLQAHGASEVEYKRQNMSHARLAFARQVIADIDRYIKPIGQLNYHAMMAQNLVSKPIDPPDPHSAELIQTLSDAGILQYRQRQLYFSDEDSRFFVNGGWLEGWVYQQLVEARKTHPRIQDAAWNIRIQRAHKGGKVNNEIDAAFLHNNHLTMIECKTLNFNQKQAHNNQKSKGAETLYKLDSVTDLAGGLQARALLVSLRKLRQADHDRAAELGISVCEHQQLTRFQTFLARHIR